MSNTPEQKKKGRPALPHKEKKVLFHGMAQRQYIEILGGSSEVAKLVSEYVNERGAKLVKLAQKSKLANVKNDA